ncbi:MAG TPA: zinc-ribbon domain-containing protein [Candidatus Dormibacteraeota bacterium]|nr:zinc-ribbon domain-containing protein [Candidatus Dormibacteraeota bacterium]
MFCSKCGTDMPEDSRFCRSCGQTVGAAVSTGGGVAAAAAPARIPTRVSPQPKSKSTLGIVAGLVLLLVLGAVWYVQNTTSRPMPSAAQAPQPQLHTQTTGDKAFTVSAGGTYVYKFEVLAGAYNVNLKGHFSATGGVGNDIEAYLLTEDDLVNWQNGHTVHALYNSGRVTQETVNVVLPADAGKYCLVFSNKFSFLTPKAVQTNIALTYYTR